MVITGCHTYYSFISWNPGHRKNVIGRKDCHFLSETGSHAVRGDHGPWSPCLYFTGTKSVDVGLHAVIFVPGTEPRPLSCSLWAVPTFILTSFLLLGSRTVSSWEETPQVPRLPPPVHKTKVPIAMASSLFKAHELPSSHLQGSGLSTGSPERGKQDRVCQEKKRKCLRPFPSDHS